MKIAYPEPEIELSYIKGSNDPQRDSGDPYTGYDRFGRTVDMKWQNNSGTEMKDRIQYGYDRSSQRTWRKNIAAPSGQDEHYQYDDLYQVTDFARGNINLNQTAIGGIPDYEQNFTYDPTGNRDRYTTHEDGSEVLDQTRAHNQDNQITQIDGSNTGILYDRAGNALQMPPDKDGDWSKYYKLTWDAWNRLVTIKDEADATVADYQYDGTTRRTLKAVSGTTTHFYYNNLWKCVEERIDTASTPKLQYLRGARPNHRDELIRRDRDTDDNGSLDEKLLSSSSVGNRTNSPKACKCVQRVWKCLRR
ncbi:MAG: hypothetical protein P1V20_10965 [Verrucomicrobiales bacterium]|nr:hypothetical protein [Verrucomicrobiales bacterium]